MDNCKACGSDLKQDESLCPKCGEKVPVTSQLPEFDYDMSTENSDTKEHRNTYVSPVIKAVPDMKTKKKNKGLLTAAVLAAMVVITGGILIFAKPFKKSAMNPASNPDAYIKSVLQKMYDESKKDYVELISGVTKEPSVQDKDASYEASLDVEIGTFLSSLLSSSGIAVNNMKLDVFYDKQGEDVSAAAGISLNNEFLVSAQAVYNAVSNSLYLSVPELSSSYLTIDIEEILKEAVSFNDFTSMNFDFSRIPSKQDMEKSFDSYCEVILNNLLTDVKFTENVNVVVDDLSVKYNSFEADLTYSTVFNLAEEMLNVLNNNDAFGSLIEEYLIDNENITYSMMLDELANLKKEYTDSNMLDEKLCTVIYYVDKSDDLLKGIEFIIPDDSNAGSRYMTASNGNKYRTKLEGFANGQTLFGIHNSYTKKNDKSDGTLTFSYSHYDNFFEDYNIYEIVLDYSDFEYNPDKSILKGNMNVTTTVPQLNGASLSLTFNCSEKSSKFTLGVAYLSQNLINIKCNLAENNNGKVIDIDKNQPVYDLISNNSALDEYLNDADLEAFIYNILDKLGTY